MDYGCPFCFPCLVNNRRNKKEISIDLWSLPRDKNTPSPFVEDLSQYGEKVGGGDCLTLSLSHVLSRFSDHIVISWNGESKSAECQLVTISMAGMAKRGKVRFQYQRVEWFKGKVYWWENALGNLLQTTTKKGNYFWEVFNLQMGFT